MTNLKMGLDIILQEILIRNYVLVWVFAKLKLNFLFLNKPVAALEKSQNEPTVATSLGATNYDSVYTAKN